MRIGIAAADVICCARLGEHAAGENHAEAIVLVEKASPGPEHDEAPPHRK